MPTARPADVIFPEGFGARTVRIRQGVAGHLLANMTEFEDADFLDRFEEMGYRS